VPQNEVSVSLYMITQKLYETFGCWLAHRWFLVCVRVLR